jgi:hypothetical protein
MSTESQLQEVPTLPGSGQYHSTGRERLAFQEQDVHAVREEDPPLSTVSHESGRGRGRVERASHGNQRLSEEQPDRSDQGRRWGRQFAYK